MLDTCNVMTIVETHIKEVSLRLNKVFKKYGKVRIAADESDAILNLKNHWINNIRLRKQSSYKTVVYVDFSYPKFFFDDNKKLINTEEDRKKVNSELLKLIREFSNDYTIRLCNIEYLRVDVAYQFEDIFEDYYLVFSILYETFVESMGAENKKSKKYIQIENRDIYPQDYTTGFTYTKGEYKINVYNKTAQTAKGEYVPGKKSIIRVEQVFCRRFLINQIKSYDESSSIDIFTIKTLKLIYSKFLENKIGDRLNSMLEAKNQELRDRISKVLKKSSRDIKAEIKDMQFLIIDFEMVRNIIIKNSDIDVKERMKRYYCQWIKDSLMATENNGSTRIKFFNNFTRLEKILSNLIGVKTKIEFIQGNPKIDFK